MTMRLRDLIRAVRACKTAADERMVISKESAAIRTAFKEPENPYRHRNVAKLLYIHMLGHKSHFGQIECLALIASPKFAEKRIGYLSMMVLLHESSEVLMLGTNSLKVDLSSQNPYSAGLALCALGNISSPDIARDLQSEVEKLLRSTNAYIRKKATLVALRTIRKVDELLGDFVPYVKALILDNDHGVQICAVSLIVEMIKLRPKLKKKFTKLVPDVVNSLKKLVVSGFSPEYDICGLTDPFLQVQLIRLLRVLGADDEAASDEMNDILAQVATNTEPTKNPGNAILYECVRAIMSIEAESGLRVMAINILGRFLLNKDNNIRYVALNTLCQCVRSNSKAIQRHRNTIVDCLKDADVSIRRRALDLIYALVNKGNVKALVKELLKYLTVSASDDQFKADLTAKATAVIDRYAPTKRWHIDTLVQVLETAGNYTMPSVSWRLVTLIQAEAELRAYSVHLIYESMLKASSQAALVYVGLWVIGEYGGLLASSRGVEAANIAAEGRFKQYSEESVLDTIEACMKSQLGESTVLKFAIVCLLKLSARFNTAKDRIQKLMEPYRSSIDVELQCRSIEFLQMLNGDYGSLRNEVLAPIPPVDLSKVKQAVSDDIVPDDGDYEEEEAAGEGAQASEHKGGDPADRSGNLVDLLDMFGGSSREASSALGNSASGSASTIDVLQDIFGSIPISNAAVPATGHSVVPLDLGFGFQRESSNVASPANDTLLDLLSGFGNDPIGSMASLSSPVPTSTKSDFNGMQHPIAATLATPYHQVGPKTIFDRRGLSISFEFRQKSQEDLSILATFSNSSAELISNVEFKAAVPKYLKIKLHPASGTVLEPMKSGGITQAIDVRNSLAGQRPILMRVKVDFDLGAEHVCEQDQLSDFP